LVREHQDAPSALSSQGKVPRKVRACTVRHGAAIPVSRPSAVLSLRHVIPDAQEAAISGFRHALYVRTNIAERRVRAFVDFLTFGCQIARDLRHGPEDRLCDRINPQRDEPGHRLISQVSAKLAGAVSGVAATTRHGDAKCQTDPSPLSEGPELVIDKAFDRGGHPRIRLPPRLRRSARAIAAECRAAGCRAPRPALARA
jgi:hypothetical protein